MAMVKKYPAEVIDVKQPIEGVYTLDMISLGKPFSYYPGQFLHLALDEYDPSSGWPESRCFSMQTPSSSEIIRITYAMKGKFTRRMSVELKQGSRVTLKLPYGDLFTQAHNKTNTVFIAGGTGITPFLALFNDPVFREYTNPALFAGFRNPSMNLYHTELNRAAEINSSFTVNYYYENENGLININDICVDQGKETTYFVSGPPSMIHHFRQSLLAKGLSPENIKTDDWE